MQEKVEGNDLSAPSSSAIFSILNSVSAHLARLENKIKFLFIAADVVMLPRKISYDRFFINKYSERQENQSRDLISIPSSHHRHCLVSYCALSSTHATSLALCVFPPKIANTKQKIDVARTMQGTYQINFTKKNFLSVVHVVVSFWYLILTSFLLSSPCCIFQCLTPVSLTFFFWRKKLFH